MEDRVQDNISIIAGRFTPISLGEMDSIRLMNRVDTKYLTDSETLVSVLQDALGTGYRAFETEGMKILPYDSLYFDTDELRMFQDHHNRRMVRQKVRTRTYLSSGLTFLEIKKKDNHSRTRKKRIGVPRDSFEGFRDNDEARSWLDSRSKFTSAELSPSVQTSFSRITLVDQGLSERLTIDFDVRFRNRRTGLEAGLGQAVIIELKQDGRAVSPMKKILLDNRVKPFRISKYCIGLTMTAPQVKSNLFRQKVRMIERINNKLNRI